MAVSLLRATRVGECTSYGPWPSSRTPPGFENGESALLGVTLRTTGSHGSRVPPKSLGKGAHQTNMKLILGMRDLGRPRLAAARRAGLTTPDAERPFRTADR